MHYGVWPLVTLIHDLKICVDGNRFLVTGFQWRGWGRGGAERTLALSPSLRQDSELLLLPKRLQAKTMPRSFLFPYLSFLELKLATQTDLHPLWNARVWVSELPSLCSSSLSGSGVHCSQFPCSRPGPRCCASLDQCPRGCSPARQCPSMGPALQEQASNHLGPSICQSHEGSSPCREQGPETWSIQVYLQPKVSSQSSMSQEPRESQEPAPSAQKPESPERSFSHDMCQKSSLLESHAPQKPLGVLSF